MRVTKAILVIIVCMAIQGMAPGQSVVPAANVHHGTYVFGVGRNGSELARSGDAVIKQLALQLTQSTERTHYSIAYSYSFRSGKSVNGKRNLIFRLDINNMSGDITANGFDLSSSIVPQLVSFDMRLIGNDGYVLDSASFANILPGQETVLMSLNLAKYNFVIQPQNIQLSSIVFGYDEKVLEHIKQLFNAINIYKAASLLAEFAQKEADMLNRKAVNPSPEMLMQIFELSGAVRLLAKLQSEWDIMPGRPDPNSLVTKQRIIAYRVHYIQKLFLANISTGTAWQSGSNINQLSQTWVSMQVERLTDEESPDFAKIIFCQLGKVTYRPDDLIFLKAAVSLILQSSNSATLPEGYYWALSDAVTKAYLREGEKLFSSGHYAEAADLLGSAARMCNAISYSTCPGKLYQQQAIAIYGTYHSYIRIARKALSGNKLTLADDYTDAAATIQHNNSHFIITDIEVEKLYGDVARAWYNSSNRKLSLQDEVAAIADLRKAGIAAKFANNTSIADSISMQLDRLNLKGNNSGR